MKRSLIAALTISLLSNVAGFRYANCTELDYSYRLIANTGPFTILEIFNTGRDEINGFHAVYTCPQGRADLFFDVVLNFEVDKSVPSGDHLNYRIPSAIAHCPGGIDAVAFSNGVIEGNAAAAAALRARRAIALDELKRTNELFRAQPGPQWEVDGLRQRLSNRRVEVGSSPDRSGEEIAVRRQILDGIKWRIDNEIGKDVSVSDAEHKANCLLRVNAWLQLANSMTQTVTSSK